MNRFVIKLFYFKNKCNSIVIIKSAVNYSECKAYKQEKVINNYLNLCLMVVKGI